MVLIAPYITSVVKLLPDVWIYSHDSGLTGREVTPKLAVVGPPKREILGKCLLRYMTALRTYFSKAFVSVGKIYVI